MQDKHLEQAVTQDTEQVLKAVSQVSYGLQPVGKLELLEIAENTNRELGYDLFEDLYYPRLVIDFARVTRAVQKEALKSKCLLTVSKTLVTQPIS